MPPVSDGRIGSSPPSVMRCSHGLVRFRVCAADLKVSAERECLGAELFLTHPPRPKTNNPIFTLTRKSIHFGYTSPHTHNNSIPPIHLIHTHYIPRTEEHHPPSSHLSQPHISTPPQTFTIQPDPPAPSHHHRAQSILIRRDRDLA